jgi:DNA-binding IclR family transcriptional regulator
VILQDKKRAGASKQAPRAAEDERSEAPRYRAPALEKGLDILELLATAPRPMAVAAIVQRLGRSTGELFRMIQVLEYRGFIEQAPDSDGYRLTGKLFALGLDQPQVKTLIEIALPVMRQLSRNIGQSCHLALPFNGQIIVVARMESSEQIGFSVRVGYSKALQLTVSGMILYAFQTDTIRLQWERLFQPPPKKTELAEFRHRAEEVRLRGYEKAASEFVAGITDISAPIMRGELAAAALTVPFVHSTPLVMSEQDAATCIKAAAKEISSELLHGD